MSLFITASLFTCFVITRDADVTVPHVHAVGRNEMSEPEVTLRLRRTLIAHNKMQTSRKQLERAERGLKIMYDSLNEKERVVFNTMTGARVLQTRGPKPRRTNGQRENHSPD